MALFAVLAPLALGSSPLLLVVTDDGEVIVSAAIPELRWELHWRHSVSGLWLKDAFAWRDGQLILTDAYTPDLDLAGLGYTPGRGALRRTPEGYHLAGIDAVIPPTHRFRLGTSLAPTILVIGEERFPLSERHPGVRVRFEVVIPR